MGSSGSDGAECDYYMVTFSGETQLGFRMRGHCSGCTAGARSWRVSSTPGRVECGRLCRIFWEQLQVFAFAFPVYGLFVA